MIIIGMTTKPRAWERLGPLNSALPGNCSKSLAY